MTMDFDDRNPGVAIAAFITVPVRSWMSEKIICPEGCREIVCGGLRHRHKLGEIFPVISFGDNGPVFHSRLSSDPRLVLP